VEKILAPYISSAEAVETEEYGKGVYEYTDRSSEVEKLLYNRKFDKKFELIKSGEPVYSTTSVMIEEGKVKERVESVLKNVFGDFIADIQSCWNTIEEKKKGCQPKIQQVVENLGTYVFEKCSRRLSRRNVPGEGNMTSLSGYIKAVKSYSPRTITKEIEEATKDMGSYSKVIEEKARAFFGKMDSEFTKICEEFCISPKGNELLYDAFFIFIVQIYEMVQRDLQQMQLNNKGPIHDVSNACDLLRTLIDFIRRVYGKITEEPKPTNNNESDYDEDTYDDSVLEEFPQNTPDYFFIDGNNYYFKNREYCKTEDILKSPLKLPTSHVSIYVDIVTGELMLKW
jgi:hypothetical protein